MSSFRSYELRSGNVGVGVRYKALMKRKEDEVEHEIEQMSMPIVGVIKERFDFITSFCHGHTETSAPRL